MKIFKIFLPLIILIACIGGKPIQTVQTKNPDYKVDFLFEHEGCRVYRFDEGKNTHYRYFTNCNGGTSWTENCGKSCTRLMEIQGKKK